MSRFSIVVLGIFMGLSACRSTNVSQSGTTMGQESSPIVMAKDTARGNTVPTGVGVKTKVVQFTTAAQTKESMDFLASDALKGRDSGSEGLEMAAKYIGDVFEKHGVAPFFKSYQDTLANFKGTTYNVVGYVPGNDPKLKDEYIVVGAHYDHIGEITAHNGDAIANGANDNASGTTMVLELAKYFGNLKSNKRSIIFALFSAEEKGLLGSKHLAERLKGQGLDLYVMLNFEMVGVPMVNKDHLVYLTGYNRSNLAQVCNAHAGEKVVGFLPKAKAYNLYQRSDNYAFHQTFGVPSHTFSTFDFTNFDHYHQVGDEVEEMDLEHMAKVANNMIPIVEGIANADEKEIILN